MRGVVPRYVHRLACDILHRSVQFKFEGSNELKEERFHPDKRGENIRGENTLKEADILDEGEAISDTGPCSSNEAQRVPPNARDNISSRDILEPPLWSVIADVETR